MISSSGPPALYEQLADKIEHLIRSGTMRPGDRIPSIRRVSAQHGVSVTTAVQAYLALEDRGLIEARPKSGFFVRSRLQDTVREPAISRTRHSATKVGVGSLQARIFDAARMPDVVPFGAAYPGAEVLPVAKLSRAMAASLPECRSAWHRLRHAAGDGKSPPANRKTISRCRRPAHAGGNHHDLRRHRGARALPAGGLAPGDTVAVESPAYFGVLQAIEHFGLNALEIPMHPRDGMDLDALERAVQGGGIRACLAVPSFSNPLGSLMPDQHKQRLLEILGRREIPLIEDDINGELSHNGPRPRTVHSYDTRGLVLLCGSFSKTLAPGYRVGWVAPGRYFEQVKALKTTSTLATASLPQLAIAEFLASGGYDHHLRSLRRTLGSQLRRHSEAIADVFPTGIKLTRPQGGFVLWVELPRSVSSLKLHEAALEEKISIAPGPMFSAHRGFQNFIRINCGHPWSPRAEQAIGTLAQLVKRLT